MPTVRLISYTGHGHPDPLYAARLLAWTKNTRLQMTPDGLEAFMAKPEREILGEIAYMAVTIPSSWEFIDLTFSISNLSRATAQQMTRSRQASWAMQSQRVTDMSAVTWDVPSSVDPAAFNQIMQRHVSDYATAVANGMPLEDARDMLPMGVHCNLIGKFNFRAFVDLVRARESLRVQGPYREIVRQMKAEVLVVWPWASLFFEAKQAKAIGLIEEVAEELAESGAMYKGPAGKLAKAADLLK